MIAAFLQLVQQLVQRLLPDSQQVGQILGGNFRLDLQHGKDAPLPSCCIRKEPGFCLAEHLTAFHEPLQRGQLFINIRIDVVYLFPLLFFFIQVPVGIDYTGTFFFCQSSFLIFSGFLR